MKRKSIAVLLAVLSFAGGLAAQDQLGYKPSAATDSSGNVGLTLNLSAGKVSCNGSTVSYNGGVLGLAASTTNYVYLDGNASCDPAAKATAFVAGDIPIATVITSASKITSVADQRSGFVAVRARPLAGTTAAIGGSALLAGACAAGTATISGAATTMAAVASPVADPDSDLSSGLAIYAFVSATDTVTVRVCAIVPVTPASVTYRVRVTQ